MTKIDETCSLFTDSRDMEERRGRDSSHQTREILEFYVHVPRSLVSTPNVKLEIPVNQSNENGVYFEKN